MATLWLEPNGDSLTTDWARIPASGSFYTKVDNDDDSEFVYTNWQSATYKDIRFLLENSADLGTINWIKLHIRCSGFVGTYAKAHIRSGSTNAYGSQIPLTNTKTNYTYQWNTDPATSAAWTWAALNALLVGLAGKPFWFSLMGEWMPAYSYRVKLEVDYTVEVGTKKASFFMMLD